MKLSFNKLIGRGSAAEVWEATDELGREVAVKFFLVGTPDSVEQNVRAHALGLHRVNHPAVARLYAVEHQPDPDDPGNERLAIIMERVPGVPLHLHMEDLALDAARLAVEQLAAGLSAIHAAGMVHGDLHDGNVMISPSGAKLIDILYTHSLREVGSRIATENRRSDVREFAVLVQKILEKTPEGRAATRALSDARYQAESAKTPADVVRAFAGMLGASDASERPPQQQVASADGAGRILEVTRISAGSDAADGRTPVVPALGEDELAIVDHAVDAILAGERFRPVRGRELRAHMPGSLAMRLKRLAELAPYLERQGASPDTDAYRPTPRGLLLSSSGGRIELVLLAALATLREKLAADPGFHSFDMTDLAPALREHGAAPHEVDEDFVNRIFVLFDLCVSKGLRDGVQTWDCPTRVEELAEVVDVEGLLEVLRPSTESASAVLMEPSPLVVLSLDYTEVNITPLLHRYELVVRLTNGPKMRLDDWSLEVEMPAAPLRAVGGGFGAKVEERSSDRRWLLRTSPRLGAIAAGDTYTFKVPYVVTDELYRQRHASGLFEEPVVVRAFVNGSLMQELDRAFSQLQAF